MEQTDESSDTRASYLAQTCHVDEREMALAEALVVADVYKMATEVEAEAYD